MLHGTADNPHPHMLEACLSDTGRRTKPRSNLEIGGTVQAVDYLGMVNWATLIRLCGSAPRIRSNSA